MTQATCKAFVPGKGRNGHDNPHTCGRKATETRNVQLAPYQGGQKAEIALCTQHAEKQDTAARSRMPHIAIA